jgi:DNA-binding SARP family transcriptional activator
MPAPRPAGHSARDAHERACNELRPRETKRRARTSRSVLQTLNDTPPIDRRLVVRLFGPLSIEDGDRVLGPRDLGGARPKQVLEILLAARGRRVPVDRLAEHLWPLDRPANVQGSLHTFVSMLRRRLTTDRERARAVIVTEPEAYRVATDLIELDLDRFDELLERSAHEPTRLARVSLEEALALARGDVLEDEPYATWALDLRGCYQGRLLGARLDAADVALAERELGAALAHCEAASLLDPFSERAHRCAMLALYALDRQHDALARFRNFRASLDEALGLEPTAETRALESAILRQERADELLPRPIERGDVRIVERDVRLLGRTRELDALARETRLALEGRPTLIRIEGDTGLGKSRLLDELWRTLVGVRVGRATCSELEQHLPYVPLAAALRAAGADPDATRMPALAQIVPEVDLQSAKTEFEQVDVLEALVALMGEIGPLVLLLDDLQWADEQTVAALGYLRRRDDAHQTALVTTSRPQDASTDLPLARLQPDTIVPLEPLTEEELAPLSIPGIYESTGGNPRFVAEAVRCGRRAAPSRSLVDALVAQCRAEGPWACRVLSAASLLEQPFEPEPLAALLDTDPTRLTEELERLCERRILRIEGLRFRFHYDLVRRALFESVSPARRRLLHERLNRVSLDVDRTDRLMGSQAG